MSYLNKMYGQHSSKLQHQPNKNPNRVLGGLKGAGVDTFSMLGEDGLEKRIPTEAYVKGLEQKLKQLEAITRDHDRKITRLNNDQKQDRLFFSKKNEL